MSFDIYLIPCDHCRASARDVYRSLEKLVVNWDDETSGTTATCSWIKFTIENEQVVFVSCDRPGPDDIKTFLIVSHFEGIIFCSTA